MTPRSARWRLTIVASVLIASGLPGCSNASDYSYFGKVEACLDDAGVDFQTASRGDAAFQGLLAQCFDEVGPIPVPTPLSLGELTQTDPERVSESDRVFAEAASDCLEEAGIHSRLEIRGEVFEIVLEDPTTYQSDVFEACVEIAQEIEQTFLFGSPNRSE